MSLCNLGRAARRGSGTSQPKGEMDTLITVLIIVRFSPPYLLALCVLTSGSSSGDTMCRRHVAGVRKGGI